MDMQPTTHVEITAEDCEKSGRLSPRRLIQLLVLAAMFRNRIEGGGAPALREAFGAVWMIRRLRLEQFSPICVGDVLQGYGSGRTKQKATYVVRGEFRRGDELVARMDFLTMPVTVKGRKKVSIDDTETLYSTAPADFVPSFDRLPTEEGLDYTISKTITPADCDSNGHFASQNYADLICSNIGYWENPDNIYRFLQMDFIKEVLPGGSIKISVNRRGNVYVVQGMHQNGKPCFNASCEY